MHHSLSIKFFLAALTSACVTLSASAGPLLRVDLTGAETRLDTDIVAMTDEFIGREINQDLLDELRAAIFDAYTEVGYFARVSYPPQDLTAGVLSVSVTELKLGDVSVSASPQVRFSGDRAARYITSAISRSEPLNINLLDRQAQALDGLNGVSAEQQIDFSPQSDVVDVDILLDETEFFEFTGQLDNLGGAATGRERLSLDAQFNSLFWLGDRTVVSGVKTEELASASLDFEIPVGVHGSRLVFGGDRTEFDIFAASQPKLDGTSERGWLRFRAPEQSILGSPLTFETGIEGAHSFDKSDGSDTYSTDKSTREWYLSSSLAWVNEASNAAANISARVSAGDLDLSSLASVLSQDASAGQTHGRYEKLNLNMTGQLRMSENTSLSLTSACQFTTRNLDSLEEIELSGPSAVRAYDVAAVSVDQGCFAQSEYVYQQSETVALFGFVDMGHGQTHRNTYAGWQEATEDNTFSIFGSGVGARINLAENYNLSFTYARRVGACDGCATPQTDGRLWLVGTVTF